jgi:hypothetical protein
VLYFRETLTEPDCSRQIWGSFPLQNFGKLHLVRDELEPSFLCRPVDGRTDTNMMKLTVVSLNYVHVRKNWAPSSRKTQSPLRRPRRWWSSEERPLFTVRIHRNKRCYRIWANCRFYECHSALRFKAAVLLLLIMQTSKSAGNWQDFIMKQTQHMSGGSDDSIKSSDVMYAQFQWQVDYMVEMTVSLLQHFAGRHVGERLLLVGYKFPTHSLTNQPKSSRQLDVPSTVQPYLCHKRTARLWKTFGNVTGIVLTLTDFQSWLGADDIAPCKWPPR